MIVIIETCRLNQESNTIRFHEHNDCSESDIAQIIYKVIQAIIQDQYLTTKHNL